MNVLTASRGHSDTRSIGMSLTLKIAEVWLQAQGFSAPQAIESGSSLYGGFNEIDDAPFSPKMATEFRQLDRLRRKDERVQEFVNHLRQRGVSQRAQRKAFKTRPRYCI